MIHIKNLKLTGVLAALLATALLAGCSNSWIPEDKEAVRLVQKYYLYYYHGKKVDAEVKNRGKILKECDCHPMVFTIATSETYFKNKVFYFFRDSNGSIDVREYKYGLKNIQG